MLITRSSARTHATLRIQICHARNSLGAVKLQQREKLKKNIYIKSEENTIEVKETVHSLKINYMLLIFCVKFAVLSQGGKS